VVHALDKHTHGRLSGIDFGISPRRGEVSPHSRQRRTQPSRDHCPSGAGVPSAIKEANTMNLTLLDRGQLEAILLDPSPAAAQPLLCSDNAVADYLPAPTTARNGRLRHVLAAAHELLTRIAAEAIKGRSLIDSPTVMKDFLRVYFAGAERETFVVVFLDANHRVIDVEELFSGTLTQTSVYPREVVKRALHFNAAAVCLSHVHPSSQTEPSRADEFLTSTLRQALSLIDVRIIDHIIVAANGSSLTSMAERGLL
jgi:DNA repair protein RadC